MAGVPPSSALREDRPTTFARLLPTILIVENCSGELATFISRRQLSLSERKMIGLLRINASNRKVLVSSRLQSSKLYLIQTRTTALISRGRLEKSWGTRWHMTVR